MYVHMYVLIEGIHTQKSDLLILVYDSSIGSTAEGIETGEHVN